MCSMTKTIRIYHAWKTGAIPVSDYWNTYAIVGKNVCRKLLIFN